MVAVGSLAELSELTGRDLSDLDPHRPFIDDVTFTLPGEEGTYRRVRQVIDAWYDSGLDAVRPVGRAAPQQGASSRPPTRRSSSARRSTRPAAGSTR